MKNKLWIYGMTFEKAIEKLNELSPYWRDKNKKDLEIDSDKDIEIIYEILLDCTTAFEENRLTESQIDEIDIYYKTWYGYSIREED